MPSHKANRCVSVICLARLLPEMSYPKFNRRTKHMNCVVCKHKLNKIEKFFSNICDNCTNSALLKISGVLGLKKKNEENVFDLVNRRNPSSMIKQIMRQMV